LSKKNEIMKKNSNYITMFAAGLVSLAIFTSCGGGSQSGTNSNQSAEETIVQAAPDAAQMALGEKIYNEKCKACHQADGKGLAPAFPPLASSDYLLSDKKRAVAQALNGSNKEIVVNGVKFVGIMPPQVNTHEDAVAVINYVLNNFGNNGGYITVDEVKDITIDPR